MDVADAIRTLLSKYSADDRRRILLEISEAQNNNVSISVPRAGGVLGAVVRLIPHDREWTVEDLKKLVDDSQVSATQKEVYNAIGYLKRRGEIRRIGYGRYIVDGVEIVTSDDLGGETTRNEDEYRVSRGEE